ncbi:probable cation-transporting ATPase 13A3 isoform X2 [Hippocampus comes]|uniref:probable cation-transporting ATPase 13A3 isoform X1 n=1 Tax=Hippocampus comes TaxID=109280 RepID=UPI00094E01C0|nr:PREDICTED: probable cation-transporting ATPase 13A3 isoform X1 [Hippocampus comes]XP_019733552.1 PREDICTED: probable cation-transporting ATPase 13A3 isoform X1 [Hippocampus comes]XP_019733553.1 PREDICTED: probable cation-transporting ATPase 13A3 isoform X2 [Hippocampus comes]
METREMTLINQGLEDEMEVWGYRPCLWKMILVGVGAVCSGGLLLLLLYWLPEWGVKATCTLSSLREAHTLLLRTTDDFRQWARAKVHVMLAPGKTPFDSVEHQSTAHLLNGHDHRYHQNLIAEQKEPNGKFYHRQSANIVHYFTFHSIRYYWNEGTQDFEIFKGLEDTKVSCADIHRDHSYGLTTTIRDHRALFFGKNEIDVQVPSLFRLFIKEVLNPFYIFQLFAIVLWAVQGYFHYSLSVLFFSLILIAASLYSIRKQYAILHNLVVAHSMMRVSVCRRSKDVEQVMSTELVPGDVITIPANGMIMPCDAVLIRGTCIVNESMLTGESVPVTKTSLPSSGDDAERIYSTEEHKRHTLFCGSHVIQSRYYAGKLVKVVVVRTGFCTEKGQLVRSILYPKPTNFKLHRDATQFLMCMVVLAVLGFFYAIVVDVILGVSVEAVIYDALNITLIAVPPIIPVALTAGLMHAQRRMKRLGIFCISPQRINISGQLNLVCFDKTGTLTEDCLDLWGVQRAENGIFLAPDTEISTETSFAACMATCHSLITIEGKLCGDPLDVKVFGATGSILEEATEYQVALYNARISTVVQFPDQSGEFGIVRQFPFSPALQRMSVVVRQLGQNHFDAYLKGAPETVSNLCKPHTVPQNFKETLETYTRQGFRVIALAHHRLDSELPWLQVQSLSREQIETNMDLLGLIIMQNKIKEQTAGVLLDLRQANIRTLMVTGDNMLTAISVARDCGMIRGHEKVIIADAVPPNDQNPATITWRYSENPVLKSNQTTKINFGLHSEEEPGYHFAVSGQAFNVITEHFPHLVPKFLLRATVFARMTPDQKTQLVQALQSLDYTVGMCGDGANDCGALKKAHSGVSLSDLEASVASPFTSSIPNISCITNLIRQGRAALVTTFCVFKFMSLFSLILFCGVILLYTVVSNFGDWQYLLTDTVMLSLIIFTMSLNPAWKKLSRRTPPTSLMSIPVLSSIIFQMLNCLLFQIFTFFLVQQQSWYRTPQEIHCNDSRFSDTCGLNKTEAGALYIITNYENTSLFYVSAFQYLIVAIVFAKGKPFRQPSYKNWSFVLTCTVLYAFILFIMLNPIPAVDELMEIATVPYDWRITLLIIILAHAVLSFILENLILDALWKFFPTKPSVKWTSKRHAANTTQLAKEFWGLAFLSRMFSHKNRPPKTKYKYLALKLQEEVDWPPAPSTITYAGTTQYHISVPF